MSRIVAQPPDGASGVVPGVYGNASNYPIFTVGGDGRLLAASSVAVSSSGVTSITGVASTGGTVAITATPNPITGVGTLALADTAVTDGTYTNATVTVDKQGRITGASSGGAPSNTTVMDNLAATKYPDAPQTNGVWYGTNAKANARTTNTNTVIGNLTTTLAGSTGIVNLGYATVTNGNNTVAIGNASSAGATGATAVGAATASNSGDVAVGYGTNATGGGAGSISIGESAAATAAGSWSAIAIGKYSSAAAMGAIAIGGGPSAGNAATASNANNVAIGKGAIASGGSFAGSIAVGAVASASAPTAVALGQLSAASRTDGVAVGNSAAASTTGVSNIAIGKSSVASADRAIAIGDGSTVSVANGIGLGQSVAVNSTSYALGFGVNSASVVPGYVGVNLNNATFQVPKYTTLYNTTATAAGTTTLTVTSARDQFFTGATTQTVVLPVTSTLALGFAFNIVNNSTGVVTVQSSGANTVVTLSSGVRAIVTCILTSGTTAASWSVSSSSSSAVPGVPYSISGAINGATGASFSGTATTTASVASMSFRYQKMPFNGGVLNHLWVEWSITAGHITGAGTLIGDVATSLISGSFSPMTDYTTEGSSPAINVTGVPSNPVAGSDSVLSKNYSAIQSFVSATSLTWIVNYIPANPSDNIRFTPAIFTWMTAT